MRSRDAVDRHAWGLPTSDMLDWAPAPTDTTQQMRTTAQAIAVSCRCDMCLSRYVYIQPAKVSGVSDWVVSYSARYGTLTGSQHCMLSGSHTLVRGRTDDCGYL